MWAHNWSSYSFLVYRFVGFHIFINTNWNYKGVTDYNAYLDNYSNKDLWGKCIEQCRGSIWYNRDIFLTERGRRAWSEWKTSEKCLSFDYALRSTLADNCPEAISVACFLASVDEPFSKLWWAFDTLLQFKLKGVTHLVTTKEIGKFW